MLHRYRMSETDTSRQITLSSWNGPPDIQRSIIARKERAKSITSELHPLYEYRPEHPRLKSRSSFMRTEAMSDTPQKTRLQEWRNRCKHLEEWMTPNEELPPEYKEEWLTWKTINRLRTGVTRCKANLRKWGVEVDSIQCECGTEQTTTHLMQLTLAKLSVRCQTL